MARRSLPRSTRLVLADMQRMAAADVSRLSELSRRIDELAPLYGEYLVALREARAAQQSMDATRAFAGRQADAWLKPALGRGAVWLARASAESCDELRESIPLWCHLRHYLRFAGEVTFADAVAAFRSVGLPASRQAMESAVRAHPQVFGRRKRGSALMLYLRNSSEYVGLAETTGPSARSVRARSAPRAALPRAI
jgi:hypothetical protein